MQTKGRHVQSGIRALMTRTKLTQEKGWPRREQAEMCASPLLSADVHSNRRWCSKDVCDEWQESLENEFQGCAASLHITEKQRIGSHLNFIPVPPAHSPQTTPLHHLYPGKESNSQVPTTHLSSKAFTKRACSKGPGTAPPSGTSLLKGRDVLPREPGTNFSPRRKEE